MCNHNHTKVWHLKTDLTLSMTANKENLSSGAMTPQKKPIYYLFCKSYIPSFNKTKNAQIPNSPQDSQSCIYQKLIKSNTS